MLQRPNHLLGVMGVHLTAKGLDIKSLAHPTSISPKPYAIRVSKSLRVSQPFRGC
jgi:hypothetical protein